MELIELFRVIGQRSSVSFSPVEETDTFVSRVSQRETLLHTDIYGCLERDRKSSKCKPNPSLPISLLRNDQ